MGIELARIYSNLTLAFLEENLYEIMGKRYNIKTECISIVAIMLTRDENEWGSHCASSVRERPGIEPGTNDLRERMRASILFHPFIQLGLLIGSGIMLLSAWMH